MIAFALIAIFSMAVLLIHQTWCWETIIGALFGLISASRETGKEHITGHRLASILRRPASDGAEDDLEANQE
jgi:hypothetical protein